MSNVCQIRVGSSGDYCCAVNDLRVRANCIGSIKFSNLPETLIEYETTPGNWAPANPASISGTGAETLFTAGTYRFSIDCEALDGEVAPELDPIGLCYECCKVDDYSQRMLACLIDLKALLAASDDTSAIAEIVANLEAICDKLLDLIGNIGDLSELCTKLETLIESLETVCTKIEEGFASMLECLEQVKADLALLCEKLDSVIVDAPACSGSPIGTPVTYNNSDIEPELEVAVGGLGDIKIQSGRGDASDQEITEYITACLVAGNNVDISWEIFGGSGGTATLLAAATTNAFPNFYNESADAFGVSGKLVSMTATCLTETEDPSKALNVTDACALECLKDIKELLSCSPATARGILTTW